MVFDHYAAVPANVVEEVKKKLRHNLTHNLN